MSRRTSEANKAIRLAWERERELVRLGYGTRDWSKEQQKDILNPDKGKAYDNEGRAFEGQHMKCVAEYPEYQGDPNNIQFLTKEEHLEAHKGSWQNPTNWYFDPITKTFDEFGDDEPIPCVAIHLSEPLPPDIVEEYKTKASEKTDNELNKLPCNSNLKSTIEIEKADASERNNIIIKVTSANAPTTKPSPYNKKESPFRRFVKKLRHTGRSLRVFFRNHPEVRESISNTILTFADSRIKNVFNSANDSYYQDSQLDGDTSNVDDVELPTEDITPSSVQESIPRKTYTANDVPAGKQRYHTKEGIVWIDKKPYHRDGKNDKEEPE